jgi:hypothetical protein
MSLKIETGRSAVRTWNRRYSAGFGRTTAQAQCEPRLCMCLHEGVRIVDEHLPNFIIRNLRPRSLRRTSTSPPGVQDAHIIPAGTSLVMDPPQPRPSKQLCAWIREMGPLISLEGHRVYETELYLPIGSGVRDKVAVMVISSRLNASLVTLMQSLPQPRRAKAPRVPGGRRVGWKLFLLAQVLRNSRYFPACRFIFESLFLGLAGKLVVNVKA